MLSKNVMASFASKGDKHDYTDTSLTADMGLPTEAAAVPLSPQLVGNAFVEQYYHVLHQTPEFFYKFYQVSSILSRPDSNGVMTSAITPEAINDLVLSLDCKNYIAEILSVDSQASYNGGVIIQVTGCLTGQDKIRRRFGQSFFLAPQDGGGFFVLNDIFRFVDDNKATEVTVMLHDNVGDAQTTLPTPEQEMTSVPDLCSTGRATPPSAESFENGEAHDLLENGGLVLEEKDAVDQPDQSSYNDTQQVSEIATSTVQEDLPKKSYASIVVKGNTSTTPVYVRTAKARPSAAKPQKVFVASPASASAAEATIVNNDGLQEGNSHKEGYSIFIRNLPFNSSALQVEEEFKKFGPIKPGGVQVRNHKTEHFCFGFVEYESFDSMQAAIKGSPVMIGGRQSFVAEKKTTKANGGANTGNGVNGGGRYSTGRGGFQNDNSRGGRGSFANNNNGGFVRGEFRNNNRGIGGAGDYSGRGRGPPRGRVVESYQPRNPQNGYGRMGRANQEATAVA